MVNVLSIGISLISLGIICWFVVTKSVKERDSKDKNEK